MSDVLEKIDTGLRIIEYHEDVRIIYACESGSRAWGFASEDSDYDVRFIYTRPINQYLTCIPFVDCIDRVNGKMDTRELIRGYETEEIDISGWDIKKCFELLLKGNPVLSEWFQSPIVYHSDSSIVNYLKELSLLFYKNKSGVYHYQHMALRNFTQYIVNVTGDVILKKYLYVLRPLYACEWIIRYDGTPPPMEFDRIRKDDRILENPLFKEIGPIVQDLIDKKKEGIELGHGSKIPVLDKVCGELLNRYEAYAKVIEVKSISEDTYETVKSLLRDMVQVAGSLEQMDKVFKRIKL